MDTQVAFLAGSGSPEGVVVADSGARYTDRANGKTYLKSGGLGNTGWAEEASTGDLPTIASEAEAIAGEDNTKMLTPLRAKDYVSGRLASTEEAEAGTDVNKLMTPALTAAAIAALAAGGSLALGDKVAYLSEDGNDTTGTLEDASLPYATAQAALTAGATTLVLTPRSTGTYGSIMLTTSINVIGFGFTTCQLGMVCATTNGVVLYGNGAAMVGIGSLVTFASVAVTLYNVFLYAGSTLPSTSSLTCYNCMFASCTFSAEAGGNDAPGDNGGAIYLYRCQGNVVSLGGNGGVGSSGSSGSPGGAGGAGGMITAHYHYGTLTSNGGVGGAGGNAQEGDNNGGDGGIGGDGGAVHTLHCSGDVTCLGGAGGSGGAASGGGTPGNTGVYGKGGYLYSTLSRHDTVNLSGETNGDVVYYLSRVTTESGVGTSTKTGGVTLNGTFATS